MTGGCEKYIRNSTVGLQQDQEHVDDGEYIDQEREGRIAINTDRRSKGKAGGLCKKNNGT